MDSKNIRTGKLMDINILFFYVKRERKLQQQQKKMI